MVLFKNGLELLENKNPNLWIGGSANLIANLSFSVGIRIEGLPTLYAPTLDLRLSVL